MSFYQELPYPVLVGTGAVLTSGDTSTLKPGQLGLFDASTYNAIGAGASPISHPSVLIAQGSWHTTDSLSKFIGGLQQPVQTQQFKAKDAIEFQRSLPVPLSQDVLQIGWDGINACNSLSFNCGTSYFFKVNVSGEDVFRTYSRPLYRFIELRTDCCTDTGDCATSCNDTVDSTYWAQQLAKLINHDVELKDFVQAEAVISNYSAPSNTHHIWNLSICDNGDVVSLAAVQTAYPTYSISRLSRVTSTSTYQVILPNATTPSNFTPTGAILQAVCGTCPAGYSSVASADYYVVKRPLAGTENLNTPSAVTTFIGVVTTDYSATSSSFLGQDSASAYVQFKIAAGTTITPVKDDTVTFVSTSPATCTPPAGSAVAWANVGNMYLTTQTVCTTIPKTCGGSNILSTVQAYYAADPTVVTSSVVITASGNCADTYQLAQYALAPVADDCLSPSPNIVYGPVQSYKGYSWDVCPCLTSAGDSAPGSPVYSGVRVTGAYVDTRFSNCSFEPTDYFSQRPLRIRLSQVDQFGNPCDNFAPVTQMQFGTVATQTGEWLIRQYLKANSLEAYNIWSSDPRTRDVFDQQVLSFIDRTQVYKVYYIVYTQDRFKANFSNSYPNDKFETIIAFPIGTDTSTFESVFAGFFSQVGVNLTERDV